MAKSPSRKVKIAAAATGISLGVAASAFAGFQHFRKVQQERRSRVACVAVSLPFVALEHNRATIQNLMEDLKSPPAKDTEDKEPAAPEAPVVLSKNIDARLLEVSQRMQKLASESEDPSYASFSSEFEELAELFSQEAAPYMTDCLALFQSMAEKCGNYGEASPENSVCQSQYKSAFKELMGKHISPAAAAAADTESAEDLPSAPGD